MSSPRLDHRAAQPVIDTGECSRHCRTEAEAHRSNPRRIRTRKMRDQVERATPPHHVGGVRAHIGRRATRHEHPGWIHRQGSDPPSRQPVRVRQLTRCVTAGPRREEDDRPGAPPLRMRPVAGLRSTAGVEGQSVVPLRRSTGSCRAAGRAGDSGRRRSADAHPRPPPAAPVRRPEARRWPSTPRTHAARRLFPTQAHERS
jgi:hypothetical protein